MVLCGVALAIPISMAIEKTGKHKVKTLRSLTLFFFVSLALQAYYLRLPGSEAGIFLSLGMFGGLGVGYVYKQFILYHLYWPHCVVGQLLHHHQHTTLLVLPSVRGVQSSNAFLLFRCIAPGTEMLAETTYPADQTVGLSLMSLFGFIKVCTCAMARFLICINV